MDKPQTVRVRIAVAVHPNGEWIASGDDGFTDKSNAETARKGFMLDERDLVHVIYVEADVPLPQLPQPTTVRGEVRR